jgi:mannose-6-phosphate isomerase
VPSRLYDHANRYGTDASRKVAINEIDATGKILDAKARLWPQTERLKAALIMDDEAAALIAWQGLKSYQYPDNPALYVDICNLDGTMAEGPAFASSLYHITCAISELIRLGGN